MNFTSATSAAQMTYASKAEQTAAWEYVSAEWLKVRARYPQIFNDRDIGTEVGPGWWAALEISFQEIVRILEEKPGLRLSVVQIKEKFGGLRFHIDTRRCNGSTLSNSDLSEMLAAIDAAIMQAEHGADHTCEICGEPGKSRSIGWIKTLCDTHHEQMIAQPQ
jgi:hypothetical protein